MNGRPWIPWLAGVLMVPVLFAFDRELHLAVHGFANRERTGAPPPAVETIFDALRTVGKFPAILLAGVLLWRLHRRGPVWAGTLAASVGGALGAAELIWRTVNRVRPENTDPPGLTIFLDPFQGFLGSRAGPSFPSSESAAAWAVAGTLAGAVPELRGLWYALAAGCSLMRVEAGAHFVSDVWVGALLGLASAALCGAIARRWWPEAAEHSDSR
jgi:membrane-associated phospholipid phosphatase